MTTKEQALKSKIESSLNARLHKLLAEGKDFKLVESEDYDTPCNSVNIPESNVDAVESLIDTLREEREYITLSDDRVIFKVLHETDRINSSTGKAFTSNSKLLIGERFESEEDLEW